MILDSEHIAITRLNRLIEKKKLEIQNWNEKISLQENLLNEEGIIINSLYIFSKIWPFALFFYHTPNIFLTYYPKITK